MIISTQHRQHIGLVRHPFHEFLIVVAIIVVTLGQFRVQPIQLLFKCFHMVKRLAHFGKHRCLVGNTHLLRQITHCGFRWHSHCSPSRLLNASNNLKHGRFACTILAYKRNLIFLVDNKTDIIKKWLAAELDM